MPLYDYLCAACGARFEAVHGVHGDGPTDCPVCGHGPVRKAITAAAIHYRGTGWAKKERRATATTGTSTASVEGGSSETKDGGSSDTKDGGSSDTKDGGSSATPGAKTTATESKTSTKAAQTSPTSASD
ncbi:MAG: zinc ribbon domain-containing protein [Chloroflexi bacterium]|nr:zinc ribbon domain-containing protein [Chloroflexota bacterium]